MTLPSFIIIGAAKAGTTSLFAMLEHHPQLYLPAIKEPEFFARDALYAEGIDSYARAFAGAGPGQMTGEASTLYSLSPLFADTAARIKAHLPQVKLIYVLREPVSRAYSYYVQILKNYQNATNDQAIHRSFEEFVLPGHHATAAPRDKVFSPHDAHLPDLPELCLAGSDYLMQIDAYLTHFGRDQMLFLTQDALRDDRAGTLCKVTNFLGLDPMPEGMVSTEAANRNVAAAHFEARGRAAGLDALGKKVGPLWALRKLIPPALRQGLRSHAMQRIDPKVHAAAPPPMQAETRAMLEARFGAQIPELEALTGLDLSHWGFAR